MNDSQYCGTNGANGVSATISNKDQSFVAASEPILTILSVSVEHVAFSVRTSVPVEGAQCNTYRNYYTYLTTSIEQLEGMLKHVKKEQAKVKKQILATHDEAIKNAEDSLKRMKDARKTQASEA